MPARCTPPDGCRTLVASPRQAFRFYAAQEQALALQKELLANPGGASVLVHFHGDGAVSFSDVAVAAR